MGWGKMKFMKYQCLQNDFIIIESQVLNVAYVCDRHKCIGADGLIVIENGNILFFNKDGTKAKFCGNGIRCAAKYINDFYDKDKIRFKFEDNTYTVTNNDNFYTLKFEIPNYTKIKKYYLVDSGVKHLVVFEKPNLKKATKLFNKYNVNITFYYKNCATTYERGVGFTLGCGSGLIAIMCILYKVHNIIDKKIFSSDLYSNLEVKNNCIYLSSEVVNTFKGELIC